MANNFHRLFSSLIEISKPNLSLGIIRSESFINSVSISSTKRRFISSSIKQDEENPKNVNEKVKEEISEEKNSIDGNEEEEDEYDGVNKETGEIGGPRGPEPTRYGDWEKGGRCSDF